MSQNEHKKKKKTMKILFYSQDGKQIIFLYTVQGGTHVFGLFGNIICNEGF